jgi:hypothetical protein
VLLTGKDEDRDGVAVTFTAHVEPSVVIQFGVEDPLDFPGAVVDIGGGWHSTATATS